ncbi:2142_t:CDS:2, partial [Cetraspora pellucida]
MAMGGFFKKAALQTPTLETFFGVTQEKIFVNKAPIIESLEECEFKDIDEIDKNEEQEKDSLKIAIVDLQKDIQQQNSPVLKLRLQAMFQYLNLLDRKWLKIDTARVASSPNYPKEACIIMTPGTNGDGWWTAEDLIAQVRNKVIPIFEERFPGAVAVFAFDNATSYAAFAPDALVAKRMNKGSKGKQPKI